MTLSFLGINLIFARYNRLRLNDIFAPLLPPGPAQDFFARVNVTEIGNNIALLADEEVDFNKGGYFNNAPRLICLFHDFLSLRVEHDTILSKALFILNEKTHFFKAFT